MDWNVTMLMDVLTAAMDDLVILCENFVNFSSITAEISLLICMHQESIDDQQYGYSVATFAWWHHC